MSSSWSVSAAAPFLSWTERPTPLRLKLVMGDDDWWYVNDKGEIYAPIGKLWLKKELNEDMRYYYEDESALGLYDYGKLERHNILKKSPELGPVKINTNNKSDYIILDLSADSSFLPIRHLTLR